MINAGRLTSTVDEVWNSKKEKEDKKRRKEASTASETSRAIGAANAVANKKRDDVEVEGQGLTLVEVCAQSL